VPFSTVHLECLTIGRRVCHPVCKWAGGGAELVWVVISIDEWGINLNSKVVFGIGVRRIDALFEKNTLSWKY